MDATKKERKPIRSLSKILTPRQLEVAKAIYCDGLTQSEAAIEFGFSQMTISRIHTDIIEKTRAEIGELGGIIFDLDV